MHHKGTNRVKGFILGMMGGIAGLLAMQAYWQYIAPRLKRNVDLGGTDVYPSRAKLDDISFVGQQHQEDESSTAALGRMIYETATGREPEPETKEKLSNLVHWGYGLLQGGLYGAARAGNGSSRGLDLLGGAVHATGLWLLGDETAVPLLGLQEGPTAVKPADHVNRYGAHLAFGLATAATTRLLERVL